MKTNILSRTFNILLIFFGLLLQTSCSLELSEVQKMKNELEDHIDVAENKIDLSQTAFKFKPVEKNSPDPTGYYDIETLSEKYSSIDEFMSDLQSEKYFIYPQIIKPETFVKVSLTLTDVLAILNINTDEDNSFNRIPQFIPTTLHLWDGTSTAVNGKYRTDVASHRLNYVALQDSDDELEYNQFMIQGAKPIRSIDFDVKFNNYGFKRYRLNNAVNTVETDQGLVDLEQNQNGEITIRYPTKMSVKVRDVIGLTKTGKGIKSSGNSSFSVPSKEMVVWLEKSIPLYKSTISLIDDETLKSKKDIESHLKKILPVKPESGEEKEFKTYFFSNSVDEILIYVEDEKLQNDTRQITLQLLKEKNEIGKEGYFTAHDKQRDLTGIIDVNGNWVLEPSYISMEAIGENNFRAQTSSVSQVYKLDLNNKKLVPL